ncbi:MAG: accessory factor UbiK family protein [Alphaproteobacteria bacterium]|nr:accessory factor UbiK family protein [Alphaproteobacteria bacterium]
MSNREKILDDLARFAGGTIEIISGAKNQARESAKSRIDELAQRLDLVPREDFEHLEATVIKLREEQEALKKEVKALSGAKKVQKAAPKSKNVKKSKGK